jgi:cation diffusion facilitator CzcD-associated flavoprotein CzcO
MAAAPIPTDALVIGAGPVGLWQVFQLGLHGIACQVVDALPEPGGQPQTLYPDKPLYDIPGLPRCTGRELTQRLLQQVSPFQAGFPSRPYRHQPRLPRRSLACYHARRPGLGRRQCDHRWRCRRV